MAKMRFTDRPVMHPRVSVTGKNGSLLDSQWDVHFPGPGRLYFHERDVAELVANSHETDAVRAVLAAAGWLSPDEAAETEAAHAAAVEGLEAELAAATRKAEVLEEALGFKPEAKAKTAAKKTAKA